MASPEDIGTRRLELFGHGGARTRDGAAFPNAARAHESACSASRWRKILIPQIGHSARERGGREVSFRFGARGKGVGSATIRQNGGTERVEAPELRELSRLRRNEPRTVRPIRADSASGLMRNDPKRSATSHRREHDRVTSQTGRISEAPPRRVLDARRVFVDGRTTRDQGLPRPSQRVTCFISTHKWPQRTARCDLGPLSRRGVRPPNGPISNERGRSLRAGRATPRKNDAGIVPP